VINQKDVLFVFHHFIGARMARFCFHQSLPAALSSITDSRDSYQISLAVPSVSINIPDTPLLPSKHKPYGKHFSFLQVIYIFTYVSILRLLNFRKANWIFSDATFNSKPPMPSKPRPTAERCITLVRSLHIKPSTMAKCVRQCMEHNTSFTALFETIIMVTLASDLYPTARIGFSSIQIDMRRFLPSPPGNEMINLSSSFWNPSLALRIPKSRNYTLSIRIRHKRRILRP
jgi:hypothetical protein